MFLKKSKFLIYIFLSLFVLNFMLPVFSFAIDEDSVYVWSNNSSSVSTSITSTEETENSTQDISRKLFRYYFRWSYINGPKMRNYFV